MTSQLEKIEDKAMKSFTTIVENEAETNDLEVDSVVIKQMNELKKKIGMTLFVYVFETNKNTTKKQKKEYILCKDHKTTKVEFYNYDTEKDIKKLLVEVPIEKIVSNSYSLNYSEYINNIQETKYITGVEMKTLEDICCFLPKSNGLI